MEEEGVKKITRVQSIAETTKSVPPQYIQPQHNRPAAAAKHHTSSNSNISIPVIDLSNLDLQHLSRVCKHWGAFQLTNHGVPKHLLDAIRKAGLSFFNDYPMEDKLNYSCNPNSAASQGYGSRMLVDKEDSVLDWRDYFDHHTLPLSRRNPNNWPHSPFSYRGVVMEYSDEMNGLALKLMSLISQSLGLPTSFIKDAIGEVYQNITISYYPPCPQPDLTLGLQSHSDFGAITLLIQDNVGGLQVLKDGEWITAQPISDAIVVILADQTEIITNGEYRSAQHRAVTNAQQARLSVATFHDPAKSRKIFPATQLTSEDCPARYQEVSYGDYVSSWYSKGPEGKRNLDALLTGAQEKVVVE